MYISNVHIENFRNFTNIDVPLKQFSILIGKNDTGKSNLIEAVNILLYNSRLNYYAKSLSKYDFNATAVKNYEDKMIATYASQSSNFDIDAFLTVLLENAPRIVIKLRFEDARSPYERGLLKSWLNGDQECQYFEIEYKYFLKNHSKLRTKLLKLREAGIVDDYCCKFPLIIDYYDYDLVSTNNEKSIDFTKIKNFCANLINAERDAFSGSDAAMSTRVIAKILDDSLSVKDHTDLVRRYDKFFDEIQGLDSFRSIYKDITEQNDSISRFIEEIKLSPNAKKYRDILENITLSYGSDMLFQRGLGTRNLVLLLTLYSYFVKGNNERFNLVCIEEPEAHLDINNLKVAIEFFQKSKDRSTMVQLIISTHNNQIINKLDLNNVTIINNDHNAINVGSVGAELVYYLAKRENFDTLNLMFSSRVVLVEGATEELYINTLLQKDKISNVRIISIGQKGFKTFIEIWKAIHSADTCDKLGVIRDYDFQDKAKSEHEAYNSTSVCVKTASGKEFESDFVSEGNNLELLNHLFSQKFSAVQMYDYMTSDKLVNIIRVCKSIDDGVSFVIPTYIKSVLEWIKV